MIETHRQAAGVIAPAVKRGAEQDWGRSYLLGHQKEKAAEAASAFVKIRSRPEPAPNFKLESRDPRLLHHQPNGDAELPAGRFPPPWCA